MKTFRITYWDVLTSSLAQIRVASFDIQGALYEAGKHGIYNITGVEQEMVCQDKTQEVGS